MKLSLLLLSSLVVLAVLLADAEAKEKPPKMPCKMDNCSKCTRNGKKCKKCDKGFLQVKPKKNKSKKCAADPCSPNPCQNGGSCSEGSCTCAKGFAGDLCDSKVACAIENCEECNAKGNKCRQCNTGFELNSAKACVEIQAVASTGCGVAKCTKCNKAGTRCKRCDKGTTRSYNRKKCLTPEEPDPDCPTKDCDDFIIDENGNGIDDDEEDITVEPKSCGVAKCTKCNKSGTRCKRCEAGTTRSFNRKKCLTPEEEDPDCPSKSCDDYIIDENNNGIDDDEEDVIIPAKSCGVAKCTKCNKAGTRCKRCEAGTTRSFNRKKCLTPEEEDPDCPTKDCEDYIIDDNNNGIDDDEEDVTIPAAVCKVKKCAKCNKSGKRCKKCNAGLTRSATRKSCLEEDEEDPDCPANNCEDVIIDENNNTIDDDDEDVIVAAAVCKVKKCTKCNKAGLRCRICNDGLILSYSRRQCMEEDEEDPNCPDGNCKDYMIDENGNIIDDDDEDVIVPEKTCRVPGCAVCNKAGGRCIECAEGTTRSLNRKTCLAPDEEDEDCPSKDCDDYIIDENGNGIDDDDENIIVPAKKCKIPACAVCNKAGKRCKSCAAGTTRSLDRKTCLAEDEEDPACPTKDCEDYIIDENGNGIDDDDEDVIVPAKTCKIPKCAKCNKAGNRCKKCAAGTTRSQNRKTCLSPDEEDPDCPSKACDDIVIDENNNGIDDDEEDVIVDGGSEDEDDDDEEGSDDDDDDDEDGRSTCRIPRCKKCNYNGRRCKTCKDGFEKSSNRKRCLASDEEDPDCPTGECPDEMIDEDGNGIDDDDEDKEKEDAPECNVENCAVCKDDNPDECDIAAEGFVVNEDGSVTDEAEALCTIPYCKKCNFNKRRCKKCKSDYSRSSNRKRCLAEGEEDPDCPTNDCPDEIIDEDGNGIDDDEEDRDSEAAPKCNVANCAVCKADNPDKCDVAAAGFEVNPDGSVSGAPCEVPKCSECNVEGKCSENGCEDGYTRTDEGDCENEDDCTDDSCSNGGVCVDGVGSVTCSCAAGYEGDTCDDNVDDCSPNPCLNGGECTDGVDSSSCACVDGYEGDNCETGGDPCDPNPCSNGGTCSDGDCTCATGYEGATCATNTDDCSPNPCENGGECTDGVDSFTCTCTESFKGETCSKKKRVCPTQKYRVNGVCTACQLPSNCVECDAESGVCTECDEDHFSPEDSTTCYEFPAECTDDGRDSVNGCEECNDGYYASDSGRHCYRCTQYQCNTCTQSNCNTCNAGFYLSSGACKSCPTRCDVCSSSGCTQCSAGYYLDSSGNCLTCPVNCKTCTAESCQVCSEGYYLPIAEEVDEDASPIVCGTLWGGYLDDATWGHEDVADGEEKALFQITGLRNGVSSARISPGCTMILYSTASFGGRTLILTEGAQRYASRFTGYNDVANSASCTCGPVIGKCTQCISHCASCTERGCMSCSAGYYLFTDETTNVQSCKTCGTHYTKCIDQEGATECDVGYSPVEKKYWDLYKRPEYGVCKPCSAHCKACNHDFITNTRYKQTCKDDSCEEGYFKMSTDAPSCQACVVGSATCESATGTQECIEQNADGVGYYLYRGDLSQGYQDTQPNAQTCQLCTQRFRNCARCETMHDCGPVGRFAEDGPEKKLNTGAGNTNNPCQQAAYATWRDNNDKIYSLRCTRCAEGFYKSSDESHTYVPSADRYGYDHSACIACPANCANCTQDGCQKCNKGYYLNAGGTCTACTANCETCGETEKACDLCMPGYFWDGTKSKCYLCGAKCVNCDRALGCLECQEQYFVPNTGYPQACKACGFYINHKGWGAECEYCYDYNDTDDPELVGACAVCKPQRGMFFNQRTSTEVNYKLCGKGDDKCSKAVREDGSCPQCMEGYFLADDNSTCSACPARCQQCSSRTFCDQCYPGNYQTTEGSTCNTCGTGCVDCGLVGTARKCFKADEPKYYLTETGTSPACLANCEQCEHDGTCIQCVAGYNRRTDGRVCSACPRYCARQCNHEGKCEQCKEGYYLHANGHCYACRSKCAVCNDASSCEMCMTDAYRHTNTHCYACSARAITCRDIGGETNECEEGYYIHSNGKTCTACPKGCASQCGSAGSCTDCDAGYRYNELTGYCIACPARCEDCSKSDTIIECNKCDDESYFRPSGAEATRKPRQGTCVAVYAYHYCKTPIDGNRCEECLDDYWYQIGMAQIEGIKPEQQYSRSSRGKGHHCTPCPSNCAAPCNKKDGTCQNCVDGYYPREDNRLCLLCPFECARCNNQGECLKCNDETSLVDGDCILPRIKCTALTSVSVCENQENQYNCRWLGTAAQCKAGGRTLDERCTCQSRDLTTCRDHTIHTLCNHDSECFWDNLQETCWERSNEWDSEYNDARLCPAGKWMHPQGDCKTCNLPAHCGECDSRNGMCIDCEDGYFSPATSTQCYAFPEECMLDRRHKVEGCLECNNGYYPWMDGRKCNRCPYSYCEICTRTECLVCNENYYVATPNCRRCPNYCANCTQAGCQQCEEGYYLHDNGNCYVCPANCATCHEPSQCDVCRSGYYLHANGVTCVACISQCSDCQADGCSDCNEGYYLREDRRVCTRCHAKCTNCQNTVGCVECEERYTPKNLACTACGSYCQACGDGGATCTECDEDHYHTNNKGAHCTTCKVGCSTCSHDEGCTECDEESTTRKGIGLFLDDTALDRNNAQVCRICNSYISYCNRCRQKRNPAGTANVLECTNCFEGYYIRESDQRCVACPANCAVCTQAGCLECKLRYYKSATGTCPACSANCERCSGTRQCDKCRGGYFLHANGVTCSVCPHYCIRCTHSEGCTECKERYYLRANGLTCGACAANCEQCGRDGQCTMCKPNYQLYSGTNCRVCHAGCGVQCLDGPKGECPAGGCMEAQYNHKTNKYYCSACPANCDHCSATPGKCDAGGCRSTSYLHPNGITCSACGTGCRECHYDAGRKCDVAETPRYYLNERKSQVACRANCQECNTDGTCTECVSKFYMHANKHCYACPTTCKGQCNSVGSVGTVGLCVECKEKHYLHTNKHCYACPAKCERCNMDTGRVVCDECSPISYRHTNNNCYACSANCESCTQEGCNQCKENFYMHANKNCYACRAGCATQCTVDNTCPTCAEGYYKHATNGYCYKCPGNCKKCETPSACDECNEGTYLHANGVTCYACYRDGLVCSGGTQYDITECKPGFWQIFNYMCHPCPTNCASQCDTDTGHCESCLDGFYLRTDRMLCLACPRDCERCNSQGTCLKCEEERVLENGKCTTPRLPCKASALYNNINNCYLRPDCRWMGYWHQCHVAKNMAERCGCNPKAQTDCTDHTMPDACNLDAECTWNGTACFRRGN